MLTDFSYGGQQIVANGPFKPSGKDMPSDARTRVECYADIVSIPNPHIGLKITVKVDETNNNKMTDYIVKSLKANNIGVANTVIDEVVRYADYLGVSANGGSGEGLTTEQAQKLQTAYDHSQTTHVQASDIPSKTSDLINDSDFLTSIPSEYVTEEEMSTALSTKANKSDIPSLDGYATENFVTNKIAEASLSGSGVDLSGYATKDELNAKANATHTHTVSDITNLSISTYQTKTDDELITQNKTIVGAINETFQSVSSGKKLIASAITDKGVTTSNTDTFQTMANNILSISSNTQPSGQDAYREGRTLIWEDDFNGDSLDTSVWNYELGNIRNGELQVYTNNSKNVYVENSNLVLKAIKEDCEAYDKRTQQTKTFNWTSGSIQTNNTKEFKYGRFEAKIKLTNVMGSFPAFWTLGAGYDYQYTNDANMGNKGVLWPYCGEIDIMEHKGLANSITCGSLYSTSESISTATDLGRLSSGNLDFSKYHIYALEWTKDKIDIYVDDVLVSSSDISGSEFDMPFKQPHFILLNHAIGASGGTPSDSLTECYFYVDWVRVYAPVYENISSITLSKSDVTLSKIGDTSVLTAEFDPDAACDKTLIWESSNQDIAKVYGGKIHAISNGTCNITATHGDVSATCSVTVGTGVVTSTLNSISAVYTQGGVVVYPTTSLDSLKSNLVVTGSYSDGTTKPITGYSLSGALTVGTSTVTVTYNGKTTTFNVIVSEVVEKTLDSISAVYTQGGTIVYPTTSLNSLKSGLVVTANYSDGSNKTITDYSLSGTLTVGTSTVTVTYNGKTTTFNVAVSEVAEENVLFSFNSSEGTDVNTIFNISKNEKNSIKSEVVYNSSGYLEIVEKQKYNSSQDGFIRVEPKNFTVSGNIEIEARLSVEAYRNSTDADTEGVRIGIDNGSEGIYISLTQKYGVRYFNGSSAIPVSTSTVGTITANTMFNLKINIDFTNKSNAKIYMNDTLLDTIDYSNWTKSAYSNRNNFFIMPRNAIATVNTIKIKNI